MKQLIWRIGLSICLLACSQSEEGPSVQQIRIEVDKTAVLSNTDTVSIQADVLDGSSQPLDNITLTYFANGQPLGSNQFIPIEPGVYELTAQFESVSSNAIQVEVFDKVEDLETLTLAYEGYSLLTTHDWSLTGNFSVQGGIGDLLFDLSESDVTYVINGQATEKVNEVHFEEAGIYTVYAEAPQAKSNEIRISVREEKEYPVRTLPIIFHNYGVDLSGGDLLNLVDTLNASFNREQFSQEEVRSGSVNPNAVNVYVRFELATEAPDGFILISPGLQNIPSPGNEYPELSLSRFQMLEEEYGWDPDTYVNIWLASSYGFEFPEVNPADEGNSSGGRGIVNSPILEFGRLDGLLSLAFPNPRIPIEDPNEISPHILLRSGSVLGEHPDYIVNRVGYYLGLFDTFEYPCTDLGDFCGDTFVPDLSQGLGPLGVATSCEGLSFRLNNHMSINRNYTCFTYDQRERIQFVLENGWGRP